MKKRALLVAFLGVAVVSSTVLVLSDGNEELQYSPRTNTPNEGYSGAAEYYKMLHANIYTGEVEISDILEVRKAYKTFAQNQEKAAVGFSWLEMGPDNVGGRTRTIEFDPFNPTVMYCGGVSGGLWKSTNGANLWTQVTSFEENVVVSSIAFLGNGNMYVATGSSHDFISGSGGSGFIGRGIYRSTDGGQTFESVVSPTNIFNPSTPWAWTDEIVADPNNSDGLWVAHNRGLRYYDESDDSFTSPSGAPGGSQNCEAIAVSADGSVVIASIGVDAYVSTDYGQSFTNVSGGENNGQLPSSGVGRIELAISQDDPNYVFALISSQSNRMHGVFSSTDKGLTWTRIWPPGFGPGAVEELDIFNPYGNPQGWYDNVITVVPGQPDKVIVGGVTLWSTALSGQPEQIAIGANFPGCFLCVHSDLHEFEWDPSGDTLYIGCDGGVYKSWDDQSIFIPANRGLSITQFYGIGYGPNGKVIGGTQDNSSPYLNFEGPTQETATILFGGDGFDCDISQMDPDIMFASSQNGNIGRSSDEGVNFGFFYDARILALANGQGNLGDFYTTLRLYENYDDPFSPGTASALGTFTNNGTDTIMVSDILGMAFTFEYLSRKVPKVNLTETVNIDIDMIIDPDPVTPGTLIPPGGELQLLDTLPDRVESLFAVGFNGTQGVWVTRGALTFSENPEWWKVINTTCNVTALEFSGDGNHLFVGCSDGKLRRVSNFNMAYDSAAADVTSTTRELVDVLVEDFSGPITGIAPDPNDPNRLFVTLGGYGGSGKVRFSDNVLTGGNFVSRWLSGTLAGMPVYDGIIHVSDGDLWVVGTEHGVFSSNDAGVTWTQENDGMNVVPTYAVRQQLWDWENNPYHAGYIENPGVIYLGTHGRGIFRTETLLGIEDELGDAAGEVIDGGLNLYPNPMNTNGSIAYELNESTDVFISIYNMQGKLIDRISKPNSVRGSNIVEFSVEQYPVGTYIAHLEAGNIRKYGRFVVMR